MNPAIEKYFYEIFDKPELREKLLWKWSGVKKKTYKG